MSLRALASAAGVATSTIHRVEKGDLNPTIDVIDRIVQAAGMRVAFEPQVDHRQSLVGLALSIRDDIERDPEDRSTPIRRAAELVSRYLRADDGVRARMVAAEPPATGDHRWDALLGGLAEWLTVGSGVAPPSWADAPGRFLDRGWWVTSMPSMRAWEYAGAPMSLKTRGVYLHRDSLLNV